MASPNAPAGLAARAGDGLGRARPRSVTSRMPLPPPPAEALTSSGKPTLGGRGSPAVRVVAGRRARRAARARPPRGASSLASTLRPIARDRVRRRPDEHEPGVGARRGEVGVLGEEAVARVDRVGARATARRRGSSRRPGRTRPAWTRPARRPRSASRDVRRVARPGRSTRRRCGCPSPAPCGSPGARSRRGWRRAACGSPRVRCDPLQSHPERRRRGRCPRPAPSGRPTARAPSTVRVSRGSMMPSSQTAAGRVERVGLLLDLRPRSWPRDLARRWPRRTAGRPARPRRAARSTSRRRAAGRPSPRCGGWAR